MFDKILTYAKLSAEQKVNVLLAAIMVFLYIKNTGLEGQLSASQDICREDKKEMRKEFDLYKREELIEHRKKTERYDELWNKWEDLKKETNHENKSS